MGYKEYLEEAIQKAKRGVVRALPNMTLSPKVELPLKFAEELFDHLEYLESKDDESIPAPERSPQPGDIITVVERVPRYTAVQLRDLSDIEKVQGILSGGSDPKDISIDYEKQTVTFSWRFRGKINGEANEVQTRVHIGDWVIRGGGAMDPEVRVEPYLTRNYEVAGNV